MGSAASKQTRVLGQTAKAASQTPLVKPSRGPVSAPQKPSESMRPDGHDPQEIPGGHQQLLNHLRSIEPHQAQAQSPRNYKPASKDSMSRTLEARQHYEVADQAAATKPEGKTLVPGQTITAIVRMLNRGEPRDQIVQTFKIDPSVLDKLAPLSIPTAPGPQGGVGIRRSR